MQDIQKLLELALERKYLAVGLLAVYTLVRLLKDDARFLPDVQGRYRAAAALLLGVVAGVLERLDSGVPMREAITAGFTVGAGAIFFHVVGVDLLRHGKELPLPAALRKTPPSDPPPPPGSTVPGPFIVGMAGMIMAAVGCAPRLEPLGPGERAELARHTLGLAACRGLGLEAGTLPDGGKDKNAGLTAFDACVDGGGR